MVSEKGSICYFLFLLCSSLNAELEWKVDRVETNLPVGSREIVVNFPYSNAGSSEVEILNESDCCGYQVIVNEAICSPNSNGVINVKCNVSGRYGTHYKKIRVGTSDGQKDLVILFKNPRMFRIYPKRLNWEFGELTSKKMRLTNLTDIPIAITDIRVSNEICEVSVNEIKVGYIYELELVPFAQGVAGFSYLDISTDYIAGGVPLQVRAYAQIRKRRKSKGSRKENGIGIKQPQFDGHSERK